jgi:DNA adenine methylase
MQNTQLSLFPDTQPAQIRTQPFLKWLGSKRWAVDKIRPLWLPHQHRRLVDLTLGSGALPLGLQPKRFLGCDINAQLIQLWQWVQKDGEFTLPLVSSESWFKTCRDRYNNAIKHNLNDPELPQLLYLLCRTCFNGVHRSSSIKAFNVGWNKEPNFGGQTDLTHYKEIIGHWQFMAAGYEKAIATLQQDDFVIFDPPYDSEDGKAFVGYHGKFTSADQVKSAELIASLDIPVVAFNASTVFIKEVYQNLGFEIQEVMVARSVSCKGDERQAVPEIIATKNL